MEIQEKEFEINDREFAEYLEKDVVVLLKNGVYLSGIFKSYDQYNSITLNYVIERIFHKEMYSEKRQGLAVIRGENIVFIGTGKINLKPLKKMEFELLSKMIKEEKEVN